MRKKKQIPNCAICKWSEKVTIVFNNFYNCIAQGNIGCYYVYNNRKCRKLYEIKE